MELVNNINSEKKIISYLSNCVKLLSEKSDFNKYKIIHECCNYAEIYFSNKDKQGKLKREIVCKVVNSILNVSNDEIIKLIDLLCDKKLLIKYRSKILMFLRRQHLKRKIKIFLKTNL